MRGDREKGLEHGQAIHLPARSPVFNPRSGCFGWKIQGLILSDSLPATLPLLVRQALEIATSVPTSCPS